MTAGELRDQLAMVPAQVPLFIGTRMGEMLYPVRDIVWLVDDDKDDIGVLTHERQGGDQ